MLRLRGGLTTGAVSLAVLLVALTTTVGLSGSAWAVGLVCGAVVHAAVGLGALRAGVTTIGPADVVTMVRAGLACAIAALATDALVRPALVALLVLLATLALLLDLVDGWVARRTRTVSPYGGKLDGEIDAFLILVLSVYVAVSFAGWVLVLGATRYVFALAGRVAPWMRAELPFRYWRKVVTAAQGIALTAAAADVLPHPLAVAGLLLGLGLLAESFGRDVWWLWRHRSEHRSQEAAKALGPIRRLVRHPVTAGAVDALALVIVWVALIAPNQAHLLTPAAFLRVPVEGLVVVALALVLPRRARQLTAVVVGFLLGLLVLVKVLDIGFFAALDRPFNAVTDSGYLGPTVDLVQDALGPVVAAVAVVAAAGLVVALLAGMPLAVRRLTSVAARHQRWSLRAVTALVLVWAVCAATNLQNGQGAPVASTSAGRLVLGQVRAVSTGLQSLERFEQASAHDRFRQPRQRVLLGGLQGKDVLVVFVESYGRAAIQGSKASSQVRAVLDAGTRRMAAAGYASRSAWLTSPTFGGLSWLAHSTLQTGLWVDNQQRYEQLFTGHRMTLSRAFGQTGWRSVAVMPSLEEGWAEGEVFYQFDEVYGTADLDYAGPRFGWSRVPDQFVLSRFAEEELTPRDHVPVMAKIDLTSSHTPWAPLPRLLPWDRLGDGSVYRRIQRHGESAQEVWQDRRTIRDAYTDSIAYCLRSVVDFVKRYGDDDLVVVLLGDHQPNTVVTGHGASHDVPVTVLARDPAVIDAISGWSWQEGMRPDGAAPVWRMDAFRDRFLDAYSPWLPAESRQAAAVGDR